MFRTSKQRSTRQLRLDPSDPAYVVLVALGDQTTEREVTEGLQLAKVDFGALDLILQAAAAGLLSYNLGTIYWDKALLHEASLSLATHELVPTVARFSLVATHDFTYQGSRRLNAARWAFYLNDDRMLAHCYVSMRDLVAYFLSASAQWVSTRSPSMASALLDHVGCGLIFHAKLPPEWQKLLSDHPDWGFPIAVMRGDLERAASCCKSGVGFEETLWFLRGDAAKVIKAFKS